MSAIDHLFRTHQLTAVFQCPYGMSFAAGAMILLSGGVSGVLPFSTYLTGCNVVLVSVLLLRRYMM